MILVTDLESNSLIDFKTKQFPSTIHCAVIIDITTRQDKVYQFADAPGYLPFDQYWKMLDKADKVVGHNILQYDRKVIAKHLGYLIPIKKIEDTLVYSKLLDPKRQSGHSLKSYGIEFGIDKPEHDDWTKFSPEMMHRCTEDAKINAQLYRKLIGDFNLQGFSRLSYEVERELVELFYQAEEYGNPLDVDYCLDLLLKIKDEADELKQEISAIFPALPDDRKSSLYSFTPKFTKTGELHKISQKKIDEFGLPRDVGDCTLFEWREFDINSQSLVKKHLLRLGWQPLEFTEKGSPQITEESLVSLSEKIPEIKKLKDYYVLRNREGVLERWLQEVDADGYVHSPINHIGTWTHRCSHTNFMGNPPRVEKDKSDQTLYGLSGGYGYECRNCWAVPAHQSNLTMVGADASGIQMRAFAHYIDDPEYIKIVSDPANDIHRYNQHLSGLSSRSKAKTFIYAFLLGAGNHKVGVIYDPAKDEYEQLKSEIMSKPFKDTRKFLKYGLDALSIPENDHNYTLAYRGMLTKDKFIEAIPGLKKFRDNAKPGWHTMLDGRKINIPNKHLVLAAYLQSFEKAVVARSTVMTAQTLNKRGTWFKLLNQVHDENQFLTESKNAKIVGDTFVMAIERVGELYKSKCPLTGTAVYGRSWAETH